LFKTRLYVLEPAIGLGVFMCPLPYVEEVRDVKIAEREQLEATEFREHVEVAKNILGAFNIPKIKYMPNPAVAHVRGALEEMLRVRDSVEVFDECQPPLSRLLKVQDACREWQQRLALLEGGAPSTYKADYKRPKSEVSQTEIPTIADMQSHVLSGTVSKMTAVTLKAFLKIRLNIGDSGNKAELVDRVLMTMQNLRL
jgi:hypothetical protein